MKRQRFIPTRADPRAGRVHTFATTRLWVLLECYPFWTPERQGRTKVFHGTHCVGHDLQNALDVGGVGSVCVALEPRMAGSILAQKKFEYIAFFSGKFESLWPHIKVMSCHPK
ncbi:hypothetical protein C0J52_21937 [Blattella germanica]|nr:hypothetical protein C0J52_21937 [Blattella germanica]